MSAIFHRETGQMFTNDTGKLQAAAHGGHNTQTTAEAATTPATTAAAPDT